MNPENSAQLKKLVRDRAVLKTKVTKLKNYADKPVNEIIIKVLEEKLARLENIEQKFDNIQTKIDSLVPEANLETEAKEREDFEDEICYAIGKAKAIIAGVFSTASAIQSTNSQISVPLSVPGPSNLNSPVTNNANIPNSNTRLPNDETGSSMDQNIIDNETNYRVPRMDLPKFEGSYEKWPGFSDAFKSAVHNNRKFTDSEKLMYLRSCLLGKAAEKIESLETTSANYQVAWSILEKNYDDPAAVINNRVRALFDLVPCQNTAAASLGDVLDNAAKHYYALEALKRPFLEAFPIYLILSKLDSQTRLKWKEESQGDALPTMSQLFDFLHSRRRVLETHKIVKNEKSEQSGRNNTRGPQGAQYSQRRQNGQLESNRNLSSYATHAKPFCHLCKGTHFTQYCEKLVNATVNERINIIKKSNLCFNCLKSNHLVEDCRSSHCKTCNKKHHSLLHIENEKTVQPTHVNAISLQNSVPFENIITTAVVYIMDQRGTPHECRVLLDSCSQPHLLTNRMASKLNLPKQKIDIPLGAVNSMSSRIEHVTRTTVKSRINNFSLDLDFLIVNEINERLPSEPINKANLNIPSNLRLADPNFNKPGPIDGIIGAEYFLRLLTVGQRKIPNQNAILQNTVFGWIIAGKITLPNYPKSCSSHLYTMSLTSQIEKFWEIENFPNTKILSNEEDACEIHFQKNVVREKESGKYTVRLPFKENVADLGESYSSALKRFYALERSLAKKPEIKVQYCENLKTYEACHHMTEVKNDYNREGYYLPHHAVIKESSLTTQLRVVFDGSAKSATGLSLNDVLMIGPTIQDNLFSLLTRFRSHAYVLTADIEKMYRQFLVHPEDRKYQKILWREDSQQPVKTFELNTVTYGTSAASFLATRSLHQLANDESESFPRASQILKNDFYVDDMLTGASTREEAKKMRDELIEIMRKGGLNLRKWASNDYSLIESLSECSEESLFLLNLDKTTKTLGVHWNSKQDSLVYAFNKIDNEKRITKRNILSQIAQLFDPLGLLGPVIVHAKILMQSLWKLGLGWDAAVPAEIHTSWCDYRTQLSLLDTIRINRKIVANDHVKLQLHGFSDASERAYGACIYIRSQTKNERIETHLVCSKSRVAPLKSLTVPKLELCAALLLAQLFEATSQALHHMSFEKTIFWSDSTIVLHWIGTPSHLLPTFEGNRVTAIQRITNAYEWRHVRSENNPADLVSRGLLPSEFINANLWQNGPSWLSENEDLWPRPELEITEIPKRRTIVSHATTIETVEREEFLDNFSSLDELKRLTAFCLRVTHNAKSNEKLIGDFSIKELKCAMTKIVKIVQREAFQREIKILNAKQQLEGKLIPLAPFLDSEGILRVGGRLNKADLPYSQKHPALLPQKHHLTNLIIREEHIKMMHGGTQTTLNALQKEFWIVNGRNVVKNVIHKCVICARAKPVTPQYVMGDLPRNRISFERPFLASGIDYCGPFFIKEKRHRNRTRVKIYAAIFVCLATKAIHIELVSDLTTEAFLAALSRFFNRRGKSSDLYSDNATNFVGAKNEIESIQNLLQSQAHNDSVKRVLAQQNIAWHFIPPRSPHFGGLWEAAVKSFKYHMLRVIGERLLLYEELLTFTIEVEAILNSRPITPVLSDPNDLSALTPGHFLIGDSITSLPEENLKDIPSGRLSSWQHVQQMRQHFWNRWYKEYLNGLNVKRKWHNGESTNVRIGDLVTLREDNVPPMQWVLGRIIAIHPGSDNIVRVVTVKTHKGEYKRSVKKISPLPLQTTATV